MEESSLRRDVRAACGRVGASRISGVPETESPRGAGVPRDRPRVPGVRGVGWGTRRGAFAGAWWLGVLGLVLASWANGPGSQVFACPGGGFKEASSDRRDWGVEPVAGSVGGAARGESGVRPQGAPSEGCASLGRGALPAVAHGAEGGGAPGDGGGPECEGAPSGTAPPASGRAAGAEERDGVDIRPPASNPLPRARRGQGNLVSKAPGGGGMGRATELFSRHSFGTRTVRSRKASRPDGLATPRRSPGWEVAPSGRARFPCRFPGGERVFDRDRRIGIGAHPGASEGVGSKPRRLRAPGVGRSRDAPAASGLEPLVGAFPPGPGLAAVRPEGSGRRARSPSRAWGGGEGVAPSRPVAPVARTGDLVERAAAGS